MQLLYVRSVEKEQDKNNSLITQNMELYPHAIVLHTQAHVCNYLFRTTGSTWPRCTVVFLGRAVRNEFGNFVCVIF